MKMDGMALLQGMIDGDIPPPGIQQSVPMRFISVENGAITLEAEAGPTHLNPMGMVHGGFAATILDTVTGCSIHSTLSAGDIYSTVEISIKMIKMVPAGQTVTASGRILKVGSSIAFSEGDLRNAKGELLAHATCTCAIRRAKSARS